MNSYWTEAAQLYLILHQSFFWKISASQIWSFEECLFPEASLSLFLSGGMIFTSLQNISFIIGLHCIICLDHFNLILLRYIIGDIFICIFTLITFDLHYKLFEFHTFCPYKYQHLHQIAVFSLIFSLYHTIWAIKVWRTKYGFKQKHIQSFVIYFLLYFV